MKKEYYFVGLVVSVVLYTIICCESTKILMTDIENVAKGEAIDNYYNEEKLSMYKPMEDWYVTSLKRELVLLGIKKGRIWVRFEFTAVLDDGLSYSSDTVSFDIVKKSGVWCIESVNFIP